MFARKRDESPGLSKIKTLYKCVRVRVCLGVSVLHTVLERECVNTPPLVEYVFVCLEIETHIGSIRAMGRGTGCEYQIASESP